MSDSQKQPGGKIIHEVKAIVRFLRHGPRKIRLVADVLKGMDVQRARAELLHIAKRASDPPLKLLDSAIANAKNNFSISNERLFIKRILINQGPVLKRFMPRAHGRAAEIRKRSSHVTLILGVLDDVKKHSIAATAGSDKKKRQGTADVSSRS